MLKKLIFVLILMLISINIVFAKEYNITYARLDKLNCLGNSFNENLDLAINGTLKKLDIKQFQNDLKAEIEAEGFIVEDSSSSERILFRLYKEDVAYSLSIEKDWYLIKKEGIVDGIYNENNNGLASEYGQFAFNTRKIGYAIKDALETRSNLDCGINPNEIYLDIINVKDYPTKESCNFNQESFHLKCNTITEKIVKTAIVNQASFDPMRYYMGHYNIIVANLNELYIDESSYKYNWREPLTIFSQDYFVGGQTMYEKHLQYLDKLDMIPLYIHDSKDKLIKVTSSPA